MHRTFISTIIASALTLTGVSASMAQAGEYRRAPQVQYRTQNQVDPLAATIAGIATLFIIGKAIENNGGFDKTQKPKVHAPAPQVQKHAPAPRRAHNGHNAHRADRGHNGRRAHNNRGHHRGYEWHRHGNGHGHKHPHGPRHHRGRH